MRIDPQLSATYWNNKLSGATAIIADGNRLVLFGVRRSDQNVGARRIAALRLTGDDAEVLADGEFDVDDAVQASGWIGGRGAEMHLVTHRGNWGQISVEEIFAALEL